MELITAMLMLKRFCLARNIEVPIVDLQFSDDLARRDFGNYLRLEFNRNCMELTPDWRRVGCIVGVSVNLRGPNDGPR